MSASLQKLPDHVGDIEQVGDGPDQDLNQDQFGGLGVHQVGSLVESADHDRDADNSIPVVGFPALVFYPCGSLGGPIESEGEV